MICPKCGFTIPDGTQFCNSCGAKLDTAPTPVQAAPKVPVTPAAPVYTPKPNPSAYPPPSPGAVPPPYRPPMPPQRPVPPPKKNGTNPVLFMLIGAAAAVVVVAIVLILVFFVFGNKPGQEEVTVPTPEPIASVQPATTAEPTPDPTAEPTPEPTSEPTAEPTPEPTAEPTPEPTAEPTPNPTPNDTGYLIPDSNKRKLTYEDLEGMTHDEMVLARNEIFARHGRRFSTKWIQKYFDSQSWYRGTIDSQDFDNDTLSSVERYNVNFIKDHEDNASNLQNANQTAANTASGSYADVIRKAMDSIPDPMSKYYDGGGVLCDLTGDGVEELLMVYFVESGPAMPESCVFSVYTLENSKAKPLLNEELLYMAAGGPDGDVNVMRKDGVVYIGARKSDWNPTDGDYAENPGYWNMYKVVGPTILEDIRVDYCEVDIGGDITPAESTAVINGESVTYEEYLAWRDSFEFVLSIDDWEPETTLPELLDLVS